MNFPECSPYEPNPIHDSKLLFINPSFLLNSYIEKHRPSHLVLYSQFLDDSQVRSVLEKSGFKEVIYY